jgi:hypothetical protein
MLQVENIGKPMQTVYQGFRLVLLPIEDTAVWNEMVEELMVTWTDAPHMTIAVKCEGRGPT